jgi:hypothetical protein
MRPDSACLCISRPFSCMRPLVHALEGDLALVPELGEHGHLELIANCPALRAQRSCDPARAGRGPKAAGKRRGGGQRGREGGGSGGSLRAPIALASYSFAVRRVVLERRFPERVLQTACVRCMSDEAKAGEGSGKRGKTRVSGRDRYLRTKSSSSALLTGLSTKSAARESSPLVRRMNVRRVSSAGSSAPNQPYPSPPPARLCAPSMRRLAMSTTVSLTPRSFVPRFLPAISAASSESRRRSSASRARSASGSGASSGLRGTGAGGSSGSRAKRTRTAGTRALCLRTQSGASKPSGYSGDAGVRGERGLCPPASAGALRGGNWTSYRGYGSDNADGVRV